MGRAIISLNQEWIIEQDFAFQMKEKDEVHMMTRAIQFKELKPYISKRARLSICRIETLGYENYHGIEEVTDIYDELYVYGIGRIKSEFLLEGDFYAAVIDEKDMIGNDMFYGECIEIVLSANPRFKETVQFDDNAIEGVSSVTALLAQEVVLWSEGKMDLAEANEIVPQYIACFALSAEALITKGLTWHAKEILTHTRNMQFSHRSEQTESNEEQSADRIFEGRVNETRFFIVSKNNEEDELKEIIDASIVIVSTKDRPGMLFDILKEFHDANINLKSIMSRPLKTEMGKYKFYIECNLKREELNELKALVNKLNSIYTVNLLGAYNEI